MTEFRPNRRKNEPPYYLSDEGKEYHDPNHAQMISAVKGGDKYHRIRPTRTPFWLQQLGYAVMVLVLLILAFGSLFVIAEALNGWKIVK